MRQLKPYLWTLFILWGLPILAVLVGYAVLDHDVPPGSCEGIGFGCTLSPADALIFWAMIVGVPVLVPAGAIGLVVVAVVQWARTRRSEPISN
jgi:hypothetical protein